MTVDTIGTNSPTVFDGTLGSGHAPTSKAGSAAPR